MSGICSVHQGYEPGCRNCNAAMCSILLALGDRGDAGEVGRAAADIIEQQCRRISDGDAEIDRLKKDNDMWCHRVGTLRATIEEQKRELAEAWRCWQQCQDENSRLASDAAESAAYAMELREALNTASAIGMSLILVRFGAYADLSLSIKDQFDKLHEFNRLCDAAALAKNPNPSGQITAEASSPLPGPRVEGEASGPVGLGPDGAYAVDIQPNGWKLVPITPTEAMHAAANREWDGRMSARSAGVWQAMIAAAPEPDGQLTERIPLADFNSRCPTPGGCRLNGCRGFCQEPDDARTVQHPVTNPGRQEP